MKLTPLSFVSSFVILLSTAATSVPAQINKARASPRVQVRQQVGLVNVTLDYSRPGVKDRKIFGTLEPFGKVWRTGADASTKIGFDGDVTIGGKTIAAGTYALYTIPGKKRWTVIIHKKTSMWGANGYDEKNDLLRLEVPVHRRREKRETLSIDFEKFHANGADLVIAWDDVKISLPVFVDSDALVLAEIDEKINKAKGKVSAATYFDAGMFYYEKKIDLPQAAKWIDKAVAARPDAFWQTYFQAELAFTMKNKKKAKRCAETALAQARKSPGGDFGYIAKCEMLLKKIR